jgi:hypothetical protein
VFAPRRFGGTVSLDNRRVEVALDYAELRSLAAAEGVPMTEVLKQFKAAGATSVALQEDTIGGLEEARLLSVTADGPTATSISPSLGTMSDSTFPDRIIAPSGEDALRTEGGRPKRRHDRGGFSPTTWRPFTVNQSWSLLRGVGVGLDPQTVSTVRSAGLGIVGRVGNWNGVTPQGLSWTLAS